MKRLQRIACVLFVSGALASMPALAQQRELPRQPPSEPMQGMMGMQGMMMGGMGDAAGRERPQLSVALEHRAELALTEPQVTKLESLSQRFRGAAEQRMREIDAAERELAALLKQDASASPPVEAKVRAIEKLRSDLRLERIRTIAEGRASLGAEQRAKLDQLVAASGRGMMGMERGGHGGSSRPEQK